MSHVRDKANFARTLKSARLGLADAQYEVGLMYANGVGVDQDFKQAMHWVRLAAERGHVAAQYLLATRYGSGVAIDKDEHQAMVWYLRAAAQGHPKAYFKIGNMHARAHPEAAASCYLKAAEWGVHEAQLALGKAFFLGDGVLQDFAQALHWYTQAAVAGMAAAQTSLAQMYEQGGGCAVDLESACSWYRRAAAQHYAPAQIALARLDVDGLGRKSSPSRRRGGGERRSSTVKDWIDAADRSDADVWYHLGLMFEAGSGLEEDKAQAEAWYLKAAQTGHLPAQVALAKLLESQNESTAVEWFTRAAHLGDSESQLVLGRLLSGLHAQSPEQLHAFQWFMKAGEGGAAPAWVELAHAFQKNAGPLHVACLQRAADLGHSGAQFSLAQRYVIGHGVTKNLSVALKWYRMAAEQGCIEAQAALGACYLAGDGCEPDFQMALHWLEKAAIQGDARAQWNLGTFFSVDRGELKRDLRAAFVWFKKAAVVGFVPAQATLGGMLTRIRDFEQAAAWLNSAAREGDPEAQYNLALAYIKGQGVPKDLAQAFQWMVQAAEQGVPQAQARLGLMYVTGEGVALDPVEAHKWLMIAALAGDVSAQKNKTHSEAQLGLMQLAEARRRMEAWSNSGGRRAAISQYEN